MNKTLPLFLSVLILTSSACAPQLTETPVPQPAVIEVTRVPVAESPTVVDRSANQKSYANSAFGFGFQFPSSWFGPEEYISEQDLRLEVGSDKVYPYGTDPAERINELKNSYNIVIQYSKGDQNDLATDPGYQALFSMKDGESFSDARSLMIRVRQLEIGRFKGFEYITTLLETGQSDRFYSRSIKLFDEQSNSTLTILGQPINVEVSDGTDWRDIYRMIDEANLAAFHQITDSITVE